MSATNVIDHSAANGSAPAIPIVPVRSQSSAVLSTQALLTFGATGTLAFVGVALVEGATRPGYSAFTHYVSELSLSDQGWMQIANFVVCGLLIIAGAVGLSRAIQTGPGATWGPRLIGLYGVSLVAAGVFVTDPTHGYPAGLLEKVPPTLHGILHGLAGLVCFASVAAAAFVMARRGPSRAWAAYSTASAIIVVTFFILDKITVSGMPTGLVQRVGIVAGWTWAGLLMLRAGSVWFIAPTTPTNR